MRTVVKDVALEVVKAITPITIAIVILQFAFIRMPLLVFVQFLIGVLLVMLGMWLFLIGVKIGILPMGEAIGSELPKRGALSYVIAIAFLIGFAVTVAEPDVIVLSHQVDVVSEGSISHILLISVIAIGVGFFVAMADGARELFEASGNPSDELWIVPGAGHSQVYKMNPVNYIDKVSAFFDGVTAGNRGIGKEVK